MATKKPAGKKPTGQNSTGGLNRPLKSVKMIQARCSVCSPRGQGKRGWEKTCEHEPYTSMVPLGPPKPRFVEQEDGTFTPELDAEGRVVTDPPKYAKRPNWKQIADDPKVASGRMITIQRERGSKFPEELGYEPICDYFNCWETNPKFHAQSVIYHEGVQTVVGNYHTRDEAAIMRLRLTSTPIYVGLDSDIGRRREQLANTPVE
jgi:hypothetical protein